jgi:outer membrane usher protein
MARRFNRLGPWVASLVGRTASGLLAAVPGLLPPPLSAQPVPQPVPATPAQPAATGRSERLVLSIRLNGRTTDVVSEARQASDGALSVQVRVLRQLGLLVGGGDDDWLNLAAVEGVSARLDKSAQALQLDAVGSAIQQQVFDAQGDGMAALPAPPPAFGSGTLSYDAFLQSASAEGSHSLRRPDLSVNAFGEWVRGAHGISTSGLATTLGAGRASWQRLESAYEYRNPASRDILRLGDNVSGALAWTRALRFGGLRWSRDFRLRPDLITLPSPQFTGSAAVPSTVDVYVNQALRYTQAVDAGPFVIRHIPVQAGVNDTTVVLRDASGRLQQFSLPFVAAPAMLAPGLSEASVELGWPRIGIASGADRYAGTAFALGSLRHGWTESLTVEAHAEAAGHFALLGAGAVGSHPLGWTWALAAAASRARMPITGQIQGHTVFGSFTAQLGRSSLAAATQRSSSGFADAARLASDADTGSASAPASAPAPAPPHGAAPPVPISSLARALDRLQWSLPLLGRRGRASVSWVRSASGDSTSRTWGASLGIPVPGGGSLDAGAAQSAGSIKTRQFWLRLSWNWDTALQAFAAVRSQSGEGRARGVEVGVQKPLEAEPGSTGFSIRAARDDLSGRIAALDVQHVTRSAVVEAQLERGTQGSFAALQASGSLHGVVLTPDGASGQGREWLFFAAPYASGAFAVLDLGWPDVRVYRDHSLVGRTDASGRALIPQLEPQQPHSLAIEASDLPLDVHVPSADVAVTPYWRGAIRVHVPVRHMPDAALVILHGRDSQPLPVGSRGVRLDGAAAPVPGTEFVVGHDGRAYVSGLVASNRLRIRPAGAASACVVAFELTNRRSSAIGPLACE